MLMSEVHHHMMEKKLNQYTLCGTCGEVYMNHWLIGEDGDLDKVVVCHKGKDDKVFTIGEEHTITHMRITRLLTAASTKLTLNQ